MQLASILPVSNGYQRVTWEMTAMMLAGAEAQIIVRSRGRIQVIIDYSTDITLANSDEGLCLDSTLYKYTYEKAGIIWPKVYRRRKSRTKLHVES